MNCAVHTDIPAAAYCRTCGKALCENCKRDVVGAIYCEPCIAARLQGGSGTVSAPPPPLVAATGTPSPGVAMLLGFIPGVGAMYNGQFMKGFVHVVIFVMAIIAADSISGYFGFLIAFSVIYMAFDAYKTAEARRMGVPPPDPLGLDRLFGMQDAPPAVPAAPAASAPDSGAPLYQETPPAAPGNNAPVGAILLIGLGVLFLLDTMGYLSIHKLWPLILIGLGLWIAYKHTTQRA